MEDSQRLETAKTALEQKYGEEFTVIETSPADAGGFYAWAMPDSRPGIVFRASMSDDGSSITDDYPVRIACHDLTDKAEWCLKEYEGEVFVFTDNVLEYTIDDINDITPEKHLEDNPGDKFYISVFVEEDTAELEELYDSIISIRQCAGVKRGSVDTYLLKKGNLSELQKEIERYEYMGSDSVKEMMNEGAFFSVDLDPSVQTPSFEEYKRGLER